MANKVKLLRSSVVTEGQPKLPTSSQIDYGELAINYADGYETISLKNSNNEIVTFSSDKIIKNIIEEDEEIAAAAFNDLNDKINDLVEITYSELYDLREAEELKPGRMYRITDFITTTTQTDTQSAEHQFDVIVTATDVNTINENAKAIKHDGDTYFANANLDAWELKYSLDNDTTKFPWADTTNGTGVIYYMKDEWNNQCPYDFKNIQFKRWAVIDVQNNKLENDTLNNLKESFIYEQGSQDIRYGYQGSNCVYGNTTHIIDSSDSDWYYTFSWVNEEGNVEDASIIGQTLQNDEGMIDGTFDNIISVTKVPSDNLTFALSNIIFVSTYSYDDGFYYGIYGNKLDTSCSSNTFGNSCYNNTFGNYCSSNTFGGGCYNNTFGNSCHSNTFGYDFSYNTFGNGCTYNTFGNSCYSNTFGNSCYYNTFGNACSSNTFGNNCFSNTFGIECSSNTFGNSCHSNTFGNYCSSNTFGENVKNITFSKDYMYYNIIENGNNHITITSTLTTSSSNKLMNFTIAQGVNNTSTLKTISHNSVNDAFKTTYQGLNSVIVNI